MLPTIPSRRTRTLMAGLVWLLTAGAVFSAGQTMDAAALVRRTIDNELKSNNGGTHFMFRDHKETPHGSQTKWIVETSEATAGMLVAIDGKPLTAEQRQAEDARLDGLLKSQQELKKKKKTEKDDEEHTTRIVKALPDAFIYEYVGTENGTDGIGRRASQLVRLNFHPNPAYQPPTRTEQVLTGMKGYLLIDDRKERIAKIDGTLIKEVSFGWGILGHLDPGGRFVVEQGDLGDGRWELTRMNLAFTGKVLLFKSLNIKMEETFADFRPVPDLTFSQAVELLKKQSAELAENHRQGMGGNSNSK